MKCSAILLTLTALGSGASAALSARNPEFELMHVFQPGPKQSGDGKLTDGGDGWFWGAATGAGTGKFAQGTIFKVRPDGSGISVEHVFGPGEGSVPFASLWNDQKGFLWGVTRDGGSRPDSQGTIFKVAAATGAVTTLYEFDCVPEAKEFRRGQPSGGLLGDGKGFLWGLTYYPGALFKYHIASGELTTVHRFEAGWAVAGPLTRDERGMLWGTGSSENEGSVFCADPQTGAVWIAARFPQGESVNPGLFSDGKGFMWGTSGYGGAAGCGAVFKINSVTGEMTTAASFTGVEGELRGARPAGHLSIDSKGMIRGTTSSSGALHGGTLFQIDPVTGKAVTTHDFDQTIACEASQSVVINGAGDLLGIAGRPVAMAFVADGVSGQIKRLAKFDLRAEGISNGRFPAAELAFDAAGFIWGTAELGGDWDCGMVFKLDPATRRIVKEIHFTDRAGQIPGRNPSARLVSDGQGFLWSTCFGGGDSGDGTLYKINEQTGEVTTVLMFGGSPGARPLNGLVMDGAGWLWGATSQGGRGGRGSLFKINPDTHEFRIVQEYGRDPAADPPGVVTGRIIGGLNSAAPETIWAVGYDPANVERTAILSFDAASAAWKSSILFPGTEDGSGAGFYTSLTRGPEGNWWGASRMGGVNGRGSLFVMNPVSGRIEIKMSLGGTNGFEQGLDGPLLLFDRGVIWGVSKQGNSTMRAGGISKFDIASGKAAPVFLFDQEEGAGTHPAAGLIRHPDGHLYGTTGGGGVAQNGIIYRLRFRAEVETLPPREVSETAAVLSGQVNPRGVGDALVTLELSASPAMAQAATAAATTVPDGEQTSSITVTRAGLSPGMTYYYRVAAVNDRGRRTEGAIRSFTTAGTLTYAGWKHAFPGGADASDDSDADGDGLALLAEYGLVFSPVDADAGTSAGSAGGTGIEISTFPYPDGKRLRAALNRSPSRSDVTVTVEATSTLAGPWETLARSVSGAPFTGPAQIQEQDAIPGVKTATVRDIVPMDETDRRFLRVRIEKQ